MPALQDVMAGHADFVFDPGIEFPYIKCGKVKLLGLASDRKSPFFPDAPTYADMGIQNASLDIWFGVWVPNKLPAPVDTAAVRKLLADEGKTLSTLIKERNIVPR